MFFYAVSFTLTISQAQAVDAFNQNISSLAIIAQYMSGSVTTSLGIMINIFAVATSFLAIFLAFREACTGIVMNSLRRRYSDDQINHDKIKKGVTAFIILISWAAVVTNVPILYFTSLCSPIFGLVGLPDPGLPGVQDSAPGQVPWPGHQHHHRRGHSAGDLSAAGLHRLKRQQPRPND